MMARANAQNIKTESIFGSQIGSLQVAIPTATCRLPNGLFVLNGQMVQNPPCWRASYTLGHPKQRKFKFDLKMICFGCLSA